MKHEKRSLEQLVEEQLSKWTCLSKEEKEEKIKIAESNPVITISREPGSGTPEIARQLSDRLQMELIAGQIAQQVAKSAERSEKVVKSMLEKEITTRNDWLTSLFASRHLKPERFLFHLTKVISAIGPRQCHYHRTGRPVHPASGKNLPGTADGTSRTPGQTDHERQVLLPGRSGALCHRH